MSIRTLYNKAYKKILPPLLKLLIFFTPLLVLGGTKEIYEFPKMHFIYFIGGTVVWLFLIKKILEKANIEQVDTWTLLFIMAYLLSTIFSTHRYTSLWGYYTRFNGGLISLLIFFGLYVFFLNELTKKKIQNLIKIGSLPLIPISLYGIWQHLTGVERIYSTLGQANWLAAYLAMIIPCVIYFMFNEKNKKHKVLWIILYFLSFTTLWFTYSISGLLGLLAGLGMFALLNLSKIKKNLKFSFLLIGVSLVIAGAQPGIFGIKIKDIFVDLKKITGNQAYVYANEKSKQLSDPGYIRTYLWKGTINMISSNPKRIFLGTGPETFPYEFQKYRPQELNYSSEWDFVFNKPHNYYLELLANIGLLGTIPYLVIAIRSIKKRGAFFTPGLVALYITNIFGWPTVTTTLLFWLFLAGVNSKK